MNTKPNPNAGSGCQTRLVRILRSVWDDVGLPPKDAAMAFVAGLLVACPVMGVIWITAWGLCKLTGKPMDDNAFMASVSVLFCIFLLCRAVSYTREKWRESGKPNVQERATPRNEA